MNNYKPPFQITEKIIDQDNDQVTVQDSNHNKNPVEKLLSVIGDNVLSANLLLEKII